MQDCVAEDSGCERALGEAQDALALCSDYLGEDMTAPGVLGGVAAALVAVDAARIWWRRHYGPTGPLFPLDRYATSIVSLYNI